MAIDPQLAALARAHGVTTRYEDWRRQDRDVAPESIRAVLDLLGSSAERSGTVVLREGEARDMPAPGTVLLEGGSERPYTDKLPAGLPLGWHRLSTGDTLVVVPRHLPEPPRAWGWMLQLYALRSELSWGMGDLGDLRDFAHWAGADTGAGLVLLNPLHAVTPVPPVPASPYSPSSRRFANPLYLRVSDTDAYRRAEPALRAQVDALRPANRDLIDYTEIWRAKGAALNLLAPLADPVDLAADPALADFATYCALAERHGPDWRTWPSPLRRPDGAAVREARAELADRVAFHAWLQHLCDRQLTAARDAAARAGMPIGIVHDLAVGIDPGGADAWMLQDVLAEGVHIGAPPDAFNQLGQDWGLAAWRPDRLAATGYAAYRDMLRAVLKHAGGIRVDHIAGLWRLWWVPPGMGAADGTYVAYDGEAMLGILALEAYRAGAVVIGEDLGTVLPSVTKGLQDRNMLGSSVLWFTRADPPAPPSSPPASPPPPPPPSQAAEGGVTPYRPLAEWPANALASISTHDLPTAAGFLTGEHVRVRADLNLLDTSAEEEQERAAADRAALLDLLRHEGLIGDDPSDEDVIVAMHAALARTPARLVVASLYDALGDLRQPNLPGTLDEYPNWRQPLPETLESIRGDPRIARVVTAIGAHQR